MSDKILTWHVPARRAGQSVEVAYAVDDDREIVMRRTTDRSGSRRPEYSIGSIPEDVDLEPWQIEPSGIPWRDPTVEELDRYGLALRLEMRDGGGGDGSVSVAHRRGVGLECERFACNGDWPDEGATVRVSWRLLDLSGACIDKGCERVEIAPNHRALVKQAGGDWRCDHDWSAEGEGGCAENPGQWSGAGSAIITRTHCTRCGLQRTETWRDGRTDEREYEVEYFQPAE